MKDEKKLLLSLKNKRAGALEAAIKLYTPYVSVVVYHIIGGRLSKEDADEVIADVFVSLWRHGADLDAEKGSIRAYLAAIARNLAKNKLRSFRETDELEAAADLASSNVEESVIANERREILAVLIRELGEPDSEIFTRYYFYDEKISKISAVTGVGASTIKTKLSRSRRKLKTILKERGMEYGRS